MLRTSHLGCCLGLVLSLILLGSGASQARGDVYRWVDEDGLVHYKLVEGSLGSQQSSAPPTPSPPPVRAAPPGDPTAASLAGQQETVKPAAEEQALPDATAPPVPVDSAPADDQQPAAPPAVDLKALEDAELDELRKQVMRDRETIKDLVGGEQTTGETLASDPRLREIADRLPRLQSELEALRGESAK